MFVELLVVVACALAALACVFAFLAWRGAAGANAGAGVMERLALVHDAALQHPKLLRDETARLTEAQAREAAELRRELVGLVQGFQGALADRFDKLGEAQALTAAHLRRELTDRQKEAADTVAASTANLGVFQRDRLKEMAEAQKLALESVAGKLEAVKDTAAADAARVRQTLTEQLEQVRKDGEVRQAQMRDALSLELKTLRAENTVELDKMRATVDEKLQGTLEKRFNESFQLVTDRLDQVHKGLGEMQTLATGVGDLKRVLTDVRQRGAWGEVQLGGLLHDMLTPDQYEKQAKVRKGSDERVDFAIRLPHDDGVLLPVDCKFPQEDYDRLLHAHNGGDAAAVEAASKALEAAIRRQARSIEEKYVHPPTTTNFAIMYLPTEGLFAEVVRRPGLASELQQRYRVTVTGPTTLSAVLNSLRMGFTSLTIQKRSSEVWTVLGAVKREFEKYDGIWEKLATQLGTASRTVDEARRKTGTITSKLKSVQSLEDGPVLDSGEPKLLALTLVGEAADEAA